MAPQHTSFSLPYVDAADLAGYEEHIDRHGVLPAVPARLLIAAYRETGVPKVRQLCPQCAPEGCEALRESEGR